MVAFEERIDPKMATFITLDDISVTMRKVLQELRDQKDEGGEHAVSGTATTTLTVLDLLKTEPYHAVKGYIINNDGSNNIKVTHNDMNKSDIFQVKANESLPKMFNNKVITKLFIQTVSGSSDYRLLLLW